MIATYIHCIIPTFFTLTDVFLSPCFFFFLFLSAQKNIKVSEVTELTGIVVYAEVSGREEGRDRE